MAITTKASFGSIPQHYQPIEQPGIKALFHSEREIALIIDKGVRPGFGNLQMGTVMSQVFGDDVLVPYPTTTINAINAARIRILNNLAALDDTCNILLEDSHKLFVGDNLMIANVAGGGTIENLGAITAIDRTTSPIFATVTFTNAIVAATFTVANAANIYLATADPAVVASGIAARFVCDKALDTGVGPRAAGAWTSVVVSNAVLNFGTLPNLDAGAIIDLGAITDGNRFLILR